jgi:hypothetical protein
MIFPYNFMNFLQIRVEKDAGSATKPYPAKNHPCFCRIKIYFFLLKLLVTYRGQADKEWVGNFMMVMYSLFNDAASADEDMPCQINLRGLMAYERKIIFLPASFTWKY